ncbi:MAG: hypothetical protein AABX05_05045 [Nanoarchaeota archaeon]
MIITGKRNIYKTLSFFKPNEEKFTTLEEKRSNALEVAAQENEEA